ncbi:MAG: 50S ribosomal protein L17 [Flavobacteriales bacterium]|nr:50S ribosomal protein L17 [Flavobacteriales bacterium]
MRHGKKINHLSRTASHRKAMLSNMACSLIEHKRINTTLAKAKALRKYVEPLITKSKEDTTHNRRVVFSYLQNKDASSILFRDVAPKIANRPGGYTRIIKLNNRLGDNAEMAMIELVDFNELLLDNKPAKKKSRRRGGSKKATSSAPKSDVSAAEANDTIEDAVVVEETTAPDMEEVSNKKEEASKEGDSKEEVSNKKEEASKKDDSKEETKDDEKKD